MKPGHCIACDKLVWRVAVQQADHNGAKAGAVIPLWPEPTSLYAQIWTPTGQAPGIPYCPACAPPIGAAGPASLGGSEILGYENAKERYQAWYSAARGDFYRAYLRDQIKYDAVEVERLMELWESDRQ